MKQIETATVTTTSVDSPVGVLTLTAVDGRLTGLFMHDQRHAPAIAPAWERDDAGFAKILDQLDEYFAGSRTDFDVPMAMVGTDFQRVVWAGLCDIPYGETRSYGQLATAVGRPNAFRAVGLANGRNPIAIIVPCHRVIGADGSLTGYGGGLDRKVWLLDHERRHAPDADTRAPETLF